MVKTIKKEKVPIKLAALKTHPIKAGDAQLQPSNLRRMVELSDKSLAREQYERDGYLLIRGLIPRPDVQKAREAILRSLVKMGRIPSVEDSTIINGKYGVALFAEESLQKDKDIKKALEHPAIKKFLTSFYGTKPSTYSYKWLRAVAKEEFTGAHFDSVYMGRGSPDLMTCWIPFGDIPVE